MSTLREDLISIISIGANNISKVEKLKKLFKQQMLDLLKDESPVYTYKDGNTIKVEGFKERNELRAQWRKEVEKL